MARPRKSGRKAGAMAAKTSRKAAKAENWADRPGNARPTDERRQRGSYRLTAGEDAGVKVAFDDASTPLGDAFMRSQISQRQYDAGWRFEELVRAVHGSPGPRSCLDWSPRGNGESEPEYAARMWSEWKVVCRAMGAETSSVMLDVCYFGEGTGRRREDRRRWNRLREGLTIAANHWGLPPDDAEGC